MPAASRKSSMTFWFFFPSVGSQGFLTSFFYVSCSCSCQGARGTSMQMPSMTASHSRSIFSTSSMYVLGTLPLLKSNFTICVWSSKMSALTSASELFLSLCTPCFMNSAAFAWASFLHAIASFLRASAFAGASLMRALACSSSSLASCFAIPRRFWQ